MPCIFCGSPNDLNTELVITIDDGNKVKVQVCDQHAEDATVKTCRIAYSERQKQIDEVLQKAKALGINISDQSANSGLIIATQQPPQPQTQQPQTQQPVFDDNNINIDPTEDAIVIDTNLADRQTNVALSLDAVAATKVSAYNFGSLTDKLPENVRDGTVKMSIIEGMAGMPTAIPTVRRDGLGTTIIRQSKYDDNALQRKFKNMADQSMNNPDGTSFSNGYTAQECKCTFCNGIGSIMQRRVGVVTRSACPKCNGAGIIAV